MKKILLTIACLMTSLAMVQALQLNWQWGSGGPDPASTAPGGVNIAGNGAGWVIQLVEYSGGYAATAAAGNVLASGTLTGPPVLKAYAGAYEIGNGTDVYLRLFNSASTTIGYYINLGVEGGSDYHSVASVGAVPEYFTGDLGVSGAEGTAGDRGTWIAIPEPGTMILFGLGALVIAARRKFRK